MNRPLRLIKEENEGGWLACRSGGLDRRI